VARLSELHSTETELAPEQVPNAVARSEHYKVGSTIAVEIARDRFITVCSKRYDRIAVIRRSRNVPNTARRSKNGDVRFTVAVIISGNGNVFSDAELPRRKLAVRAIKPVPDPG